MRDKIITGNLRVEGWLEAPNIRGFLKGLFPSVAALTTAYPRPLAGWAALVGTSLPADVYTVEHGSWIATGGRGGTAALSGEPLKALVDEESEKRASADRLLAESLLQAVGWETVEPVWVTGEYVSPANTRVSGATGFRMSLPVELKPGESITVRCDTGGKTVPIALEAGDQQGDWWDMPMIGTDISAGMRKYRYTSQNGDRVVISSLGAPDFIFKYRETAPKTITALRAVNGSIVSGSRVTTGGMLLPGGGASSRAGFGVTDRIDLSGISSAEILTYTDSPVNETRVIAVFLDGNGNPLQIIYSGKAPEGDIPAVKAEAGVVSLTAGIPAGAARARFGYAFPLPRVAANPEFRVILRR